MYGLPLQTLSIVAADAGGVPSSTMTRPLMRIDGMVGVVLVLFDPGVDETVPGVAVRVPLLVLLDVLLLVFWANAGQSSIVAIVAANPHTREGGAMLDLLLPLIMAQRVRHFCKTKQRRAISYPVGARP